VEVFTNIFRTPDLRRKVIITIIILAACRMGVYVPVPGVNVDRLQEYMERSAGSGPGRILGLMNIFAGGALSRCAVFGLGVMPYISASIIFQLLAAAIPALEQLQKEGQAGQRKISQYTRYATVGLCLVQGAIMVSGFRATGMGQQIFPAGTGFIIMAAMLLTTGTVLLMWLGEQIDQFGIGNGISLIIMVNILARLPVAVARFASQATLAVNPPPDKFGLASIIVLIAMFVLIVLSVVFITEGQRRIPFQQATFTRGHRVYLGQKHYLPLRVNQAGVIPIIFAQSLLTFPAAIAASVFQRLQQTGNTNSLWYKFWEALSDSLSTGAFLYTVTYVVLIFLFCFFWTAIQFNPQEMANNMKEHGTFILGIRPGRRTAEYLERVMTRITLPGAAFLAIIAILPSMLSRAMGLGWIVTRFYGGTSLLIVVGVALDLVKQVEAHLLMRHYDGFMRSGQRRRR